VAIGEQNGWLGGKVFKSNHK